ncbi:MAG: hypothetical protein KDB27_24335 [Planctomycetales bacterium]|nr:hypothetical protein [Planctomycetales bacterium]
MSYRTVVVVCAGFFVGIACLFAILSLNVKSQISQFEAKARKEFDSQMRDAAPRANSYKPRVRDNTSDSPVSTARRNSVRKINELRQLLMKQTQLQREQKTQLIRRIDEQDELQAEYAQLTEKHQALQEKYDQLWRDADLTLMMLADWFERDLDLGGELSDGELAGADPTQPQSDNLDLAGGNVEPLQLELDIVRWELEQALNRVATLQESAGQATQISNVASRALVEMNASSVPSLMRLTSIQQSTPVRVWAIQVLGSIGPIASEATDQLTSLLVDPSIEVATAAEDALKQIRTSGT